MAQSIPRTNSLKSPNRSKSRQKLEKNKRHTWTVTAARSPQRTRKSFIEHHTMTINNKRQTIATISTLTTMTDTTTLNNLVVVPQHPIRPSNIFHTQSVLFLFGYLCFPCWWIGGFYLKVEQIKAIDTEEKQVVTVHPSLLANGKTSSRLLWLPVILDNNLDDTAVLFYRWNRIMALVSIILTMVIVALLIWYHVAY